MLLSAQQTFSDAQALTATAVSTNLLDLGAPGTVLKGPVPLVRDIGKGQPIPLLIILDVAAGGTSPTLDVAVQVSVDAAFTSPVVIANTLQVAGGAAGDEVYTEVYLPEGANLRFIRLAYVLAGTAPTYTVTAAIVAAKQSSTVPGA